MTNIMNYIETKEAGSGFYPTPAHLVRKMIEKVNFHFVDSMLEPSAGKGNLALPTIQAWRRSVGDYDGHKTPDMDCIEIDPNLRAILKDKGLRVVHDDFLTYNTRKEYSLIIMNPPFEDAARHILKAISLLKPEGQLVALCNAETLRNPCTNERNLLVRTLGDCSIEYLEGEFLTAERKTDVVTAMITYKAPASDLGDSLILEKLRAGHKYVDMSPERTAALAKSDYVEAIIDRYNYEVESGIKLIREYRAIEHMVSATKGNYSATMSLSMGYNERATETSWVRAVRHKYWSMLFADPRFVSQLTDNLRQDLYRKVTDLENYEFSYFNIKEIMIQMNAHVSEGVESTIMALFDDWTRKYHYDENSKNRHYFDGWCTNDAFAVNKRVIIPLRAYTDWGSRIEPEFRAHNVREKLADIEKVFNYLDGGRTPEKDLTAVLEEAEKTGKTDRIETKYFFLTFYKKGTCHIEFKNMDLLAKFNIFAARGKNWLPPSFGRQAYKDMNAAEKRTVDSFMGEKGGRKYDAVVSHADYFLATGSDTLNLTA